MAICFRGNLNNYILPTEIIGIKAIRDIGTRRFSTLPVYLTPTDQNVKTGSLGTKEWPIVQQSQLPVKVGGACELQNTCKVFGHVSNSL